MDSSVKRFLYEMQTARPLWPRVQKDAVTGAGRIVGEKKDEAKLRLDLMRLRSECESRFSEIGRTFYLMNSGDWPRGGESAEHRIVSLLGQVGEREMQISDILHRLELMNGRRECPSCGTVYSEGDAFCPGCGRPLKDADKDS